jgi:Tol biopolymer transport system component
VHQVGRHKTLAVAVLAAVILILGGVAAAYLRYRSGTTGLPAARSLARLSFDSGLQSGPTWSPDGQFVAYASDRKGNFDIWVQQVGGGSPIQVTSSPAHDWQPDWSPDGKSIVFRSERDSGGLFVVPAYGGLEKKISSFGYHPMWSPDGSQILILQAGQRVYDFPKVFVVKVSDSRPREIPTRVGKNKEEGVRLGAVAWYPDGKHISFFAMDGTFWTVPLEDGAPVQSVFAPELQARLKEAAINFGNFRWAPSRKAIYLEGWSKGVLNLWRVVVDPVTLRWLDGPERLTTGAGQDTNLAITRDGKRLAFSTVVQSTRVWMLPFDNRSGRLTGPGQPVTPKDVDAWFLDLSHDGKKLVYLAHTYGTDRPELREYSVESSSETLLAGIDNYYRFFPRWSPDATRLAFSRFQVIATEADTSANPPKGMIKAGPIVLFNPLDRQEQFLTSPGSWLDYMGDWSPDGSYILASCNRNSPDRWEICQFPVSEAPHAETAMRVVASDPEFSLWNARFSPDGHWISYTAQRVASADASVVYVVPAAGGSPVRITATNAWADWPRWAPDGKTLYYVSSQNSGFLDIWGIKFDPDAGKPAGEPFRVTNYDNPSRMISTQLARSEMAFAEHSLALPLQEVSGSIWMLDGVDR